MSLKARGEMGKLYCDYLVVGCGAAGIAFVDALFTEWRGSKPPEVIMVDRRAHPGGHWCDSYPFVRLHQPAALYGVNSKVLGDPGDRLDAENLSSGVELQAYFRQAVESLEAKGVRFFAKTEYDHGRDDGAHVITSLLDSTMQYEVEVANKLVDAAYVGVTVPSTHPPKYGFDPQETTVIPLNDLVGLQQSYDVYAVVGAGKTGIDACLWLLDNQVHPDRIQWIMPNDAWMFVRSQFTEEHVLPAALDVAAGFVECETIEHFFHHLEKTGMLTRIDTTREPTMWRCATVNNEEMAKLRSIRNIIRKGRIERIAKEEIMLTGGTHSVVPNTLFIDCTSDGLTKRPAVPIFQERLLVLQPVFQCQSVYSASYIAFMESRKDLTLLEKNRQSLVIPHPMVPSDYLQAMYYMAKSAGCQDYECQKFMMRARLSMVYHLLSYRHIIKFLSFNVSLLPYLLKADTIMSKISPGGVLGDFTRIEANDKIIADYDAMMAEKQGQKKGWFSSML